MVRGVSGKRLEALLCTVEPPGGARGLSNATASFISCSMLGGEIGNFDHVSRRVGSEGFCCSAGDWSNKV